MDTPTNISANSSTPNDDDAPWKTIEEDLLQREQRKPLEDQPLFHYIKEDPPRSAYSEVLIIESAADDDAETQQMAQRFIKAALAQGTWVRLK